MSAQIFAQRGGAPNWISIAAKAGFGTTVMLSQEMNDINGVSQEYFNPTMCYGGRLGVVFVDKVGLSIEYLGGQMQQKFMMQHEVTTLNKEVQSTMKLKTTDLLPLFRYTGEYGFYCELGPKFTTVKDVTTDKEGSPISALPSVILPKDQFKGKFTSLVFGLGGNVFNGDRVQVGFGIRFAYCPKNVLETGNTISTEPWFNTPITNIEVKPLSAQLMLDINYHFAKFGTVT